MATCMGRFWSDDSGVTAIEYGLIAALIAVLLIVVMATTGTSLRALWEKIAACLAVPTAPTC